jgi:two-component system sensor histidine kinase CpxA
MKPRFSLSTKVLLLSLGNLLLLAAVVLVFARVEFDFRFDSLLVGPARDRVVSIARQAALDLEETRADGRDELLARYSKTFGVTFYLFASPLEQLAGPRVELPEQVVEQLRRPPPRRAGPPPARKKEDREDEPPPPPEGRRPPLGPEREAPVWEISTANPSMYWVGAGIPLHTPGEDGQRPGMLLMSSASFVGTPLFFDYKPWLWLGAAAVGVFVLCWLPFIRGLTRSVGELSRVTEQIAEGHFEHHLPEARRDEVGLLAGGINRMAARLSGFVNGQKRFLGDIAHELCAPIARIQFALGILEHKTEPGAVDDLQEEVRQMSSLVGELLSFSKIGMQANLKPLVAVDVAEVARQAVAREGALVRVSVEPGLRAMADAESLVRSIANLVRNAVRYAGDAGPIELTARRDGDAVSIAVADCGPGLQEDEVDRVFTPFYRVETSRNRASGGVGLGLAIVRSCVETCQGTVRCRNRVPAGLEVEIRLKSA